MLWEADLDRYPLLLCGPLLRRVTPTSVAVFVVLKEHRWVELRLYDAPTTYHSTQHTHAGPIIDTVRLGEHFYVGMATLDLSGSPLGQGTTHAYNVFFHDQADGSGPEVSLAQHDFHLLTLDNSQRIGFAPDHLPSFVVPPGDLAELRIAQGSCRKPHGMGIDMLASLDAVVADGNSPGAERPHLLVLGGDQVYADDVAPPLLRMIHDASTLLLGWDEVLDGTGPAAGLVNSMATLDSDLNELLVHFENETGPFLVSAGKQAAIDALDALVANLDTAVDDVIFTDDRVRNELTRIALRAQLAAFKTHVEQVIGNAAVSTTTPQDARDLLAALIELLADWVHDYRDIFRPLATNRGWGRVALSNEPGDLPTLTEIGDALETIRTSTSTSVDALAAEFGALFDVDADEFESADALAFAKSAREISEKLDTLTADEIKGLAGRYKDRFFPGEQVGGHYRPSRTSAPQRGLELKQFAALTSDAMDAHLMFFGEFLLMYVFAWSDAVWPQIGVGEDRTFVLPPYFESVPNYGLTGPLGPSGLADTADTLVEFAGGLQKVRRVLANVPTLMMFDDHEVTDDWNLNEDWLLKVNNEPAGAQVLRNALIAYGIFQDWGNQPDDYVEPGPGIEAPIGRKLLDMVTYVPADPNDPDDADYDVDTATVSSGSPTLKPPRLFRDTDPMDLTSAVAETNWLLGVGPQQMSELTGLTIASVFTNFAAETAYKIVPDAGRKQWDWSYDIAAADEADSPTKRNVRIISLDTRTRRAFPDTAWTVQAGLTIDGQATVDGKTAAAALMNGSELHRQLHERIDPDQDRLHIVVSPAPVFGLPLIEDVFQRIQVLMSGPEVADFESWQANPHGLAMLLAELRRADCVLVSGDVHYAYSNLLSFPESPDGAALLLQLCSSSMKNETALTQLLGAVGREGRLLDFAAPALAEIGEMIVAGFNDLPETLDDLWKDLANFGTWFSETAPLLNPFNPGAWATYYLKLKDTMLFSLNVPSPAGLVAVGSGLVAYVRDDLVFGAGDGNYVREDFTMNFMKDDRSALTRRTGAAELSRKSVGEVEAVVAPNITDADERRQLSDSRLAEMTEVVGYNNVGLITFSGPGTVDDDVQHELLWHPHGRNNEPFDDQVMASTVHGNRPIVAGLPSRIAEIAEEEHRRWNPASGRITEADDDGVRFLERYRDALTGYDPRLQDLMPTLLRFEGFPIPDAAWSAMFISYVMHRAQVGDLWFHSPRHADYVRAAWGNGDTNATNPFRLYRKDQPGAEVRVGDVVGGQPRQGPDDAWEEGIDDTNGPIPVGTGPLVATHFDIVVAVNDQSPRTATIVGGNLGPTGSGSVRRYSIGLDDDGHLLNTGDAATIRYGLIRAEVL